MATIVGLSRMSGAASDRMPGGRRMTVPKIDLAGPLFYRSAGR